LKEPVELEVIVDAVIKLPFLLPQIKPPAGAHYMTRDHPILKAKSSVVRSAQAYSILMEEVAIYPYALEFLVVEIVDQSGVELILGMGIEAHPGLQGGEKLYHPAADDYPSEFVEVSPKGGRHIWVEGIILGDFQSQKLPGDQLPGCGVPPLG